MMVAEMKKDNVIFFPVSKRMPSRIAEEKIGNIVIFKYMPTLEGSEKFEWLEKWITKKFVLLGWESVKEGLVKSFKSGKVKHLVSDVVDVNGRPEVELECGMEMHPVFNWSSEAKVKKTPVVLLTIDQQSYFRVCKNCLSATNRSDHV